MRAIFILALGFSLLSAFQKINNFKAQDINFDTKSFNELKGEKLTIIDFWATWCKPCLKSIPKLNELYLKYKNRGVELLSMNVDSPRNSAKVKPFAKTYKIMNPVLRDPNSKLARDLNVSAYPTLLIVDSEMNIVYTHIGFKIGDEKIIEEEIIKLLNEQ